MFIIYVLVSHSERFDGVATNNEAFSTIKTGSTATKVQYLDNLQKVKDETMKQINGHLYAHYSVSWNWGHHHGNDNITWRGKGNDVVRHMIDIFDSIDVQVTALNFRFSQYRLEGQLFIMTK